MAADKKDKVERKTELDSKKEALASALKKIEKDFGKGSIMRLGDAQARMNVEVIPTGILPLDIALGIGSETARSNCATEATIRSAVSRMLPSKPSFSVRASTSTCRATSL